MNLQRATERSAILRLNGTLLSSLFDTEEFENRTYICVYYTLGIDKEEVFSH